MSAIFVRFSAAFLLAVAAPLAAAAAAPASANYAQQIRAAKILVIGATGNNGGDIVRALDQLGAKPRLLVRDLDKARATFPGERDWAQGDITKPDTLVTALAGVQVVINAAATRQIDGPNGVDAVDLGGTRNLIAAAKAAGVKRIVFITGMTVGRPEANWPKPPMFRGFKAKREAELLLIASGLDYVILRPTGILPRPANTWSIDIVPQKDYQASAEELRMRPPATAPDPNGPPPNGTIARSDLAEVAVVSAVHPDARKRVFVVTQGRQSASNKWARVLRRMPRE